MTIYCVANTKGGVGKTTITLNIGVELAKMGSDVGMVNGDRQNTLDIAVQNRMVENVLPALACMHIPDGPRLRSQVQLMVPKYRDIVIDVGGRDSSSLRAALMLADVLIVPFQPRSYDVWALEDIAKLVVEAQSMRDGLMPLALLNMADPGEKSSDNEDARKAVVGTPFMLMNTTLRRRKAYADAAGAGLAVSEVARRDKKAIAEVDALVGELLALQGIVDARMEA